ncbi:MAG: PKD domain-containing protein [Candidatus Saccharibacteria bacterium]
MKIVNFRDVVTNFKIGGITKNKISFYAKRLTKETSARRLASLLLVGLLVFQFITFIAPPSAGRAASCTANDIINCGIADTSNQGVLNAFKSTGAMQLLYQAGVTDQDVLNGQANANICRTPGLLSMGRTQAPGSFLYPGHNDIWIGDASSRWLQNCFAGELLNVKVQGSTIGTGDPNAWYQVGILYDCGNLVFIPTTPQEQPKTITCSSLNVSSFTATVGQPIVVAGYAHGDNISAGELVDMAYGAYNVNTDNLAGGVSPGNVLQASGVGHDSNNNFIDNVGRSFTFSQPGDYSLRLLVAYDNNGQKLFAAGSAAGDCIRTVRVTQQMTLKCAQLDIVAKTGDTPFTPGLKGTAGVDGVSGTKPYPSKFDYILLQKYTGPDNPSLPIITYNGVKYLEGNPSGGSTRITHTNTNPAVYTDPASSPAFSATEFRQTTPGDFLIILRVTDQNGVTAPENPNNCYVPFTTTPPPAEFACKSLTADPATGAAPLKGVNLTATATVKNATVKSYEFDFGDGSAKQTISSNQLTATTKHDYNNPGKYTATVSITTDRGTTTNAQTCKTIINPTQVQYTKNVANMTLLTNDGKPTDANNQVAKAGDTLRYQIAVCNANGAPINQFVFEDDVTDLLYYADLADLGGATKVVTNGQTKLVWPATDIASLPNGQSCTDSSGNIIPANFSAHFKSFTVKVKDPIPTKPNVPLDPSAYDCNIQDNFHGSIVTTPIGVVPAKQVECAAQKLPQTGAGVPIFVISFFAASSVFLFFRNRLLKRELKLVETLSDNEGGN